VSSTTGMPQIGTNAAARQSPFVPIASKMFESAIKSRRTWPYESATRVQQETHAPQQRAFLSITSSARASRLGGSIAQCFAAFKLIASSNLVGACTGSSSRLRARRIRSTYLAAGPMFD